MTFRSAGSFVRWRAGALFLLGLLVVGLAGCTSKPAPPPPPPNPVVITVYLRDAVTGPQKVAIEAKLRALPGMSGLAFETRAQAYARFKEMFKNQPDLVARASPEDLPESFKITLPSPAAEPVLAELRQLPGVDQVSSVPKNPLFPTPYPTR
jgi:FtsX extracellular domain